MISGFVNFWVMGCRLLLVGEWFYSIFPSVTHCSSLILLVLSLFLQFFQIKVLGWTCAFESEFQIWWDLSLKREVNGGGRHTKRSCIGFKDSLVWRWRFLGCLHIYSFEFKMINLWIFLRISGFVSYEFMVDLVIFWWL
jgi:hypothetical protein